MFPTGDRRHTSTVLRLGCQQTFKKHAPNLHFALKVPLSLNICAREGSNGMPLERSAFKHIQRINSRPALTQSRLDAWSNSDEQVYVLLCKCIAVNRHISTEITLYPVSLTVECETVLHSSAHSSQLALPLPLR